VVSAWAGHRRAEQAERSAGESRSVEIARFADHLHVDHCGKPVGGRLLAVTASALASLAFACATPFAAFAVIVAAMLQVRSTLLIVATTWLVNQGIVVSAMAVLSRSPSCDPR
jgi:hypothetical protein